MKIPLEVKVRPVSYPGDTVKYDAFKHDSGFVWVRQPRDSGKLGYVAIGKGNGIERTESWGPCY